MSKHIVENVYACIPNIMKLHILQAVASKYMNSLIILPLIQKFNRIGSQKKKVKIQMQLFSFIFITPNCTVPKINSLSAIH